MEKIVLFRNKVILTRKKDNGKKKMLIYSGINNSCKRNFSKNRLYDTKADGNRFIQYCS